ncbi:MAG: iron-sulfur cluster assembly scaffold protein [Candidatus Omnitrophica bacterium]|nr:iron-sulfur cluster assembly scaffold protein [Candidatus Omnitrophota bacterium]
MIGNPEDESVIPGDIIALVKDNKYFGRMNGPDGSAYIKGICGDQMEFYIVVENNKITDIRFHTDGCVYTTACAAMACELAAGKSLQDALGVSTKQVISELKVLPKSHAHCAILAVSTLYKAIADYLLKP